MDSSCETITVQASNILHKTIGLLTNLPRFSYTDQALLNPIRNLNMIVRRYTLILLLLLFVFPTGLQADTIAYGNNAEAGHYAEVNGIKMYYETYGSGDPLLLIHGNGDSIEKMHFQIAHFARNYQVIVTDSRGHGKSGLGTDHLTYIQMMEDYNALLDELNMTQTYVFGWSDGGILALLLAIHHPDKVKKMALMGANLRPDQTAVYPWVDELLKPASDAIDEMIATNDTSDNWQLHRQLIDLLITEPNIPVDSLQQIKAPVLVMAGDLDIILGEHTLEIFENLPKAHLAIMPGQTHWAPVTDPDGFNALVGQFFETPFTRPTSRELLEQIFNPPED